MNICISNGCFIDSKLFYLIFELNIVMVIFWLYGSIDVFYG